MVFCVGWGVCRGPGGVLANSVQRGDAIGNRKSRGMTFPRQKCFVAPFHGHFLINGIYQIAPRLE